MTAIVRVAIIVVTLALFFATSFNALQGNREIAILLALGTPLGISAWGFARAGHHEAAMGLLCCVLITVVTLILVLSPLGVHDVAITAYGGVVLVGALVLSRRAFIAIVVLTFVASTTAFVVDLNGYSRSQIGQHAGWAQYVDFLVITGVFAVLGRVAAEQLFGSLGDAHHASSRDATTGLLNRTGFMMASAMRLRAAQDKGQFALLVVADLDAFRRVNLVIGHQAADHVLAEAGRRVALAAGDHDHLVGRVGDDEFAVLAIGIDEGAAEDFARRAHASLNFDFLGVSVRSAAGFSRFPRDANGIESLMLGAQSGVASAKALEDDRLSGPADRI
jgi:diguanylate cyclase (GGDEF)-like protein